MTRTHRLIVPVTVDHTAERGWMRHHLPVPDDVADVLVEGARVAGTAGGARFSRVVPG